MYEEDLEAWHDVLMWARKWNPKLYQEMLSELEAEIEEE